MKHSQYYENNGLWVLKNKKNGWIKLFCLAGRNRGTLRIATKENFKREFKKINGEKVGEYLKV